MQPRAAAIALLALLAAPLAYHLDAPAGLASPATLETAGELLGLAEDALPSSLDPSQAFYLVNLSGRVAVIDAGSIPALRGLHVGDFCILAYVNGSWVDVPFTVYDKRVQPPGSRVVLYETPQTIGPGTRIALKLPTLPPTVVDPLRDPPPQARGAARWGWLTVSPPGSKYSYPLLVAAGSPQVRRTCGEYPFRYTYNSLDRIDWLEAPEAPWPLEHAVEAGYRVSEGAIADLLRPIRVDARLSGGHGLGSESIGRPLPDGGGGGGGAEEATVVMVETLAVRVLEGNATTWSELALNVTPGSPQLFHVYPYSPNGGVDPGDIVWTKVEVVLYPRPLGGYDGVSVVLLSMYPESPYEVTRTATVSPYTASLSFTFTPPQSPYGSSDDSIPFKVSVYDGEWEFTVRVRVHYRWSNYQSYLPSRVTHPLSLYIFREPYTSDAGGLAALLLQSGATNSSAAFPVAIPGDVAIVREPGDPTAPAVTATLRVRLPPGFPGGNLTVQVPGFWPCSKSLPSTGETSDEVVVSCVLVCVPEETLLPAYSRGASIGWALLELSEPMSQSGTVYIDLVPGTDDGRLDLRGLPLVPITHPDASESYGNVILTPIVDYYDPSKFSDKTILRLSELWNEYARTGAAARWSPLLLTVSQRLGNLYSTIALHPWSMELDLGSSVYYGAGRLTDFTLNLTISGPNACSGGTGDIDVYGLSSEGGTLEALAGYLHIARKIVDYASKVVDSLKSVARVLNLVELATRYKSIVDVTTGRTCDGAGKLYLSVAAANSGWWPDGFNDVVSIRFYDALPESYSPSACYQVSAHITASTEDIIGLEDDVTPGAEACPPFAWSG